MTVARQPLQKFTRTIGLALLGSLVLSTAQAAEYRHIDPAQSEIRFVYKQMGVTMKGHFKRFDSALSFDPAAPAAASLQLDVDLASVDTGTRDGNTEIATRDWFNTAAFPQASFTASSVELLADGALEVRGQLSIKGQSREVRVPAQFSADGKQARFSGEFTIQRGDFAIGEGAWKTFDIVANDVIIQFELQASAD